MATSVLLALGLLICQTQSQLCGPSLFSGPLGLENGIYGSGPYGPLAQSICSASPTCVQPVPPCGIQAPPCGIQVPPCGIQVPPCGIQVPPCGIQVPLDSIQVPTCGIQTPQCGIQAPSCGCGMQLPNSGIPPYGVQVPPCGVQVPPCGIQAPIINNVAAPFIPNQPCEQYSFQSNQYSQCSPFRPNLPSITIPPCSSCDCVPQVSHVTTVIDNTLANSLANAIQLLIVSNLLENTLISPCNSISYSSICETVNPNPYSSLIEIVAPNYYPCNQMSCEPVYETVVAPYIEIPCYQEPIVSYAPCIELNTLPEFGFDCGVNSYIGSDCGFLNPYANNLGCSDGLVNQYAGGYDSCGLANPLSNCFGCLDSVFSPIAAEVLFPAEIPAQLTCNFGYMPTNVPCVSVNVEALPFDSYGCNGMFIRN